jgi:carboxymethylenebutenolidase
MIVRTPPYTTDQIGTSPVRFPSGIPIPTISDLAVDPYVKTRPSKVVQVEGVMFWPQIKRTFPGIVLLHDAWGLDNQIRDVAVRFACEGFVVLTPNLYIRQGGMVTGNAEVAAALAARMKEADMLQDLNSCCEFLNTRDHVLRNVHGTVGFGIGGALAVRLACQRKRLRSAVAYYGKLAGLSGCVKDFFCPVLYHHAGADRDVSEQELVAVRQAAQEQHKRFEVRTYADAPAGFFDETRAETYRADVATASWEATIEFLNQCCKEGA